MPAGVDSTRLALWAFSGGGPFLSLALREGAPTFRALVAYYAALDLRERPPDPAASISDEDASRSRLRTTSKAGEACRPCSWPAPASTIPS